MKSRLLALAGVTLLLSGCSGGMYEVPLPGGADLGPAPYTVDVQFADVADLVPQAAVKVGDVAVGRVDRITLGQDNHTVTVTVSLNQSVSVPANATARLRQSSLLGEKFVDLSPPRGEPATGRLAGGATIPVARTTRGAQIEEVLGALSLLLNGGGLDKAKTITTELDKAMTGNEDRLRSLLSTVDRMVTTLDAQKGDITKALDGVEKLSGTLVRQRGDIAGALADLAPGLKVVNEQRDQLIGMLTALDRLSGVAVDTVNKSRDDLVANLRALAPTLHQLAAAGDSLPKSLQLLLTFPLPDAGTDIIKGDYANAQINADLKLDSLLGNLGRSAQPVIPLPGNTLTPSTAKPDAPVLPLPATGNADSPGGLLGTLLGGF